ncbi:TPA_asm: penton [Physarum slime mold MELD virus]|nr:TPA_asm: penton [Physarum slime mold MELD virus]
MAETTNKLLTATKSIESTLKDLYVVTREAALNHITGEMVYVNSGFRDITHGGSNSNFFFKFLTQFSPVASRVVVLTTSIPKTYYLITEGNSLQVTELDRTYSISFPAGNYNVISFRGILAGLLNVRSSISGYGFIYSVDALNTLRTVDTGLMTLRVQANVIGGNYIQPVLTINDTLYEQLGFAANSVYTFTDNALTSSSVCNFNLHSQVYLRSDICQNSQDNILQDIYAVSNTTNSYIVFENKAPTLTSKKLNNNGQIYHFWLTDCEIGGQDVVFEVYWNGYNQMCWLGTSATDPTAGAGAYTPPDINPAAGPWGITNLHLMVATETNSEKSFRAIFMRGP